MSINPISYIGIGKRLGEVVSLPYAGDNFTAVDGTVWKATNSTVLAYSSTYSALLTDAPEMVTSAVNLGGPLTGGLWGTFTTQGIVGSSPWLMMSSNGAAVDLYYTSTNFGSTWTQRTPPSSGKNWISLWDGTNYVIYASGGTTNFVQESTDAISWTGRTGVNISVIRDFWFKNSTYLVITGSSNLTVNSTDRIAWTSHAGNVQAASPTNPGMGASSYNVGAVLFITGTGTANTYQTSPTGTTWTTRTGLSSLPAFTSFGNVGWASDLTTTTIAVGPGGYVAKSTDCVNWTDCGWMDTAFNNTSSPTAVFWDNTNSIFVADFAGIVYYSTLANLGSAWTRATRGNIISGTPIITPSGFAVPSGQQMIHQTNASSSSSTNILYPAPATDAITRNYVRIL